MSELLEHLSTSNLKQRRETAKDLVKKMANADPDACADVYELCDEVIKDTGRQVGGTNRLTVNGEFPAWESALLVNEPERVSGFYKAFRRVPRSRTKGIVTEIGCGSSAILSIGAAIMYPKTDVVTFEVNPFATQCARSVIRLLGLEPQIDVVNADALDEKTNLPYTEFAFTETFGPGLGHENGLRITEKLAHYATEILPTKAILRAADMPAYNPTARPKWQEAAELDLTRCNDQIVGSLVSTGSGERYIDVYAGYYDARGRTIIDAHNINSLTATVRLGSVSVQSAGVGIDFRYIPGTNQEARHTLLLAA